MPPSRKLRRGGQRWRAAVTASTSPPVSLSPSSESNPDRWRWASLPAWLHHPITAGLALCGMVAVSYYPALFGGFVIDDHIFADSPAVHAWSGLWNIWFSPDDLEGERHYWPILYTTFWLEHKLWGLAPFGYHLVNCSVVHGQRPVAVGVAATARRAGSVGRGRGFRSPSDACRFGGLGHRAVKTCCRDSSAWPRHFAGCVPRPPSVSAGPITQTILCEFRGAGFPIPFVCRVPALYFAAVGLFAAAMLSKSVVVTLPVAFVIVIWWKQGRVTWTDGCRIAPFCAGRPVHLPRRPVLLHVRAAGTRLRLRVCRAGADRRPSPVVLRRQAGMACRLGGRRPVVGVWTPGICSLECT